MTRRFAIVADAAGIGSWLGAITGEMTHLETIPAFDILGITRFLTSTTETNNDEECDVRWGDTGHSRDW
jgi:hypothetical protein